VWNIAREKGPVTRSAARARPPLGCVGNVSPSELALPLRRARELLGREINPILYATREFEKKRGAKDRLLSRALTGPKLWVLGNEEELGQAAR
jgi:hypothetical protein